MINTIFRTKCTEHNTIIGTEHLYTHTGVKINMETIKEMITKRDNKKIRENWKRINKLIK